MITSNSERKWKKMDEFDVNDIDIDVCLNTLANNQRWAGKAPIRWSILDHCLMAAKISMLSGDNSTFAVVCSYT